MADRVCVGAIAGAFGVRGDVRLKSFCATPEDVAAYGPLSTEDGSRAFGVTLLGPVKGGFSARLSGVTTKEAADALRGTRLYAPREALPALPDDEFYHADLIGLEAIDPGGAPLGRVSAVLNHGASDLLEIRVPGHSGTTLVPFTREIVPNVDLAAGRLVVDPPEGLFED
ncbi:MAG: ribosome maturation factor RimM [Roseicyclus sp.]